jgi:DNA repair protein RadA/Sms
VSSEYEEVQPKKLADVKQFAQERIPTGIAEVDLVFGGGIVGGSVSLLGGYPGIGKSTLVWQIAANIDGDVLYIAGEESPQQIKIRAQRLGLKKDNIYVIDDEDINKWLPFIKEGRYKLLIIDSIQTVVDSSLGATAGSIIQIKKCALEVIRKAKQLSLSTIIIGHVTKDGEVAGPKTLEHLVDGVFYLEGDRYSMERFLRSQKNRFGPTDELGVFELTGEGLVPFDAFERLKPNEKMPIGVAVTAVCEGSRIYFTEVQALVQKSSFGIPRRNSVGFDLNRLQTIIAVLSRHTKINLLNYDVFINVSEGYKLKDPMGDIAVLSALASSFFNLPTKSGIVLLGEIDLAGRVHLKSSAKKIVKAAKKMGYQTPSAADTDLNQFIGKIITKS